MFTRIIRLVEDTDTEAVAAAPVRVLVPVPAEDVLDAVPRIFMVQYLRQSRFTKFMTDHDDLIAEIFLGTFLGIYL